MLTPQLVKLLIFIDLLQLKISKPSFYFFFNEQTPFYNEWWFFISIIIVGFSLSYFLFFKISKFNKNFVKNYTEVDFSRDQIRFFMLFLGFFLPIVESILEFYKVREDSKLIQNTSIGLFLLLLYFLSGKFKFFYFHLKNIFIISFLLYVLLMLRNFVMYPSEYITFAGILISVFFAYNVFNNQKIYWSFIASLGVTLILLTFYGYIGRNAGLILFSTSTVIVIINYIRHIAILNARDKYLFADEIVNKGKSLVIATEKSGNVVYCSENIKEILGYEPSEVMNMGFWRLTEDTEFIGEDYHKEYESDRIYNRKLKCKDGSYKYIQWTDRKFDIDLFVGIGQDVTQQIQIENKYRDLIETATDIIFETDNEGMFIFINNFACNLLEYPLEELAKLNFSELIREDFRGKITRFYLEDFRFMDESHELEFPILKKSGEEVWISQKVSIKRDDNGKVKSYLGISRDITLMVKFREENEIRQEKFKRYTNVLTKLSTSPYLDFENLSDTLKYIFSNISEKSQIDRIAYWEFHSERIENVILYKAKTKIFESGTVFTKKEYPIYFEYLEKENIIVASDVYNQMETQEFTNNYFHENDIKSLLDYPIMVNGELHGILCFEVTQKPKYWDYDDINFTRSISELIVLSIEYYKRKEIEENIKYKSSILTTLTRISEKIISSPNVSEIMSEILSEIGQVTNVDRVYYFLANDEKRTASQHSEWSAPSIEPQIDNPDLQDIPYEIVLDIIVPLKAKKTYKKLVKDIYESDYKELMKSQNIKSVIIFPIFVKGKIHSFMGFDECKSERIWTDDEVNLMQTLMNYISATLEKEIEEKLLIESQEKFRLLAENIPGTVYLSKNDDKWTKMYLNDEIEKLTGYPKSAFLSNEISYVSLVHPDDKKRIIKEQNVSFSKGEKIHFTYRIIKKDGTIAWVEEFGDVVKKDNKIDFIEGIFIDITDKKLKEEAFKEKELAIAANRAKSEFLANMSHEIRTPLNGIIGFTDLLMKSELNTNQSQQMRTVYQSAKSLMELINDVLDFSKIESGNLNLNIEETNLKSLCKEAFDTIRYDAEQKNLKLEIKINDDVPATIWTDPLRLKQILINLMGNAVKFTMQGGINVKIEVINKIDTHQTLLKFSIIDTGIGIKPEHHDKIFNAFSQGETNTTKEYGGTGLGLSITNKLLGLMNSKLKLKSELNKGSEFYFELEVQSSSKEKPGLVKINVIDADEIYINPKSSKILVVEDNNINALLAKTLIKKIMPNADVYTAINGQDAVNQCEIYEFDIIFMDIQMPILNGYDATRSIRNLSKYASIPIIALTAGTVMGEKEKCLEAGMNDYLSKPILKGALENIIAEFVI
ncbi:MAG: PAS domain S-box protein [Flavobacterium sp.]